MIAPPSPPFLPSGRRPAAVPRDGGGAASPHSQLCCQPFDGNAVMRPPRVCLCERGMHMWHPGRAARRGVLGGSTPCMHPPAMAGCLPQHPAGRPHQVNVPTSPSLQPLGPPGFTPGFTLGPPGFTLMPSVRPYEHAYLILLALPPSPFTQPAALHWQLPGMACASEAAVAPAAAAAAHPL